MSRRGLQAVVALLGAVALTFGMLTMLTGAASIPGPAEAGASVESELRFYAAWFAAAGVLLLRASRRVESAGPLLRGVSVVLVAGATARLLGMLAGRPPHRLFVVLMVVEYAIPVVLLPWQARVARAAAS